MKKIEIEKTEIFDFYSKIQEIISEYESDLDKLDNKLNNSKEKANEEQEVNNIVIICLKKITFAISCELSSYFMDNVFIISKLKFQNFSDNKSFSKVLEDILYQIVKQLNTFAFKAIINIFETLRLGNFDKSSLVFFIKMLLTFYYVHTRTLMDIPEGVTKEQYEILFKKNYSKGLDDMKSMISLIPLVELTQENDEELIYSILRIDDIPDNLKERPSSNISKNTPLPPLKTSKGKGLNIKDGINIPIPFKTEDNKLNHSLTENFFQTQIK